MAKDKRICVRLPLDLYNIIVDLIESSANNRLTVSDIVRLSIERYLLSVRDFAPESVKSKIDLYFSPLSKN